MNIDQLIEKLEHYKSIYGGQTMVIVETAVDRSIPFEGTLDIDEIYSQGDTTDKPADTSNIFIKCSN